MSGQEVSGGSYTVAELLEYAKTKPVVTVNISELTWMFDTGRINKRRVAGVVIEGFPIIVTRQANGKLVTLDGFHRTYKAWQEGQTTIKAVIMTTQDLNKLKANVSIEEEKDLGTVIKQVREFGEDKDLPEDTIDDFVASAIQKHREQSAVECWLSKQEPGNGDVISVESFLGTVSDLFRDMIKGKKPLLKRLINRNDVDTISRTYGNPGWLKSRRFVTGMVTLESGSLLQKDVAKLIAELTNQVRSTYNANKPIVQKLLQQVMPYYNLLNGNDWKDAAKVNALYASSTELPIGAKFKDIKLKFVQEECELPALTADGVLAMVKLIQQVHDLYKEELNPFNSTKWHEMFFVKNKLANGFTEEVEAFTWKDPRHAVMMAHYKDDRKTGSHLSSICEEFATFGYGCEYDWASESENGTWQIAELLEVMIKYIDASVK